jgi:hypothetical protein
MIVDMFVFIWDDIRIHYKIFETEVEFKITTANSPII